MSKKLSYRGKLPIGEQDRIRLRTITGKTGYKIVKFQVVSTTAGAANSELIGQIFKTDQTGSVTSTIDFSKSDLLAVSQYHDANSTSYGFTEQFIFDNEIVNQDIFVNITDISGSTAPANYYIELEVMKLTDVEATNITLKSLRTIEETI
jgi:hypothetical protein